MRDAGSVPALTADMVQSLRDAIKLLTVLCKADAAVIVAVVHAPTQSGSGDGAM
jgi:hypothetical protein